MTQQDAPSRPTAATAAPTTRSWRRPGMPHVLRLGRLRPAVPPTTGAPPSMRRRIPRRWRIAGGVAVASLVVLGLWVVLASPWLVARSVQVVGATAATRAQVEQVAAVPLGTPLARVPLGEVADRVRSITSVDEVAVTRSWPSTVTITVTQATPSALVRDGGGFALVSDTGEPYRTVATRPQGLPLAAVQASRLSDDAAARAALDVAVAIGSADSAVLRRLVDRVRADGPLQVTVVLRDGTPVTWGSPVGSQVKAQALLLLLRAEPRASAYDVSAPTTPSVTP